MLKKNLDARYVLLWFMVTIYPLVVIPHPFYITYPGGTALPGYFYAPRYLLLVIVSVIALFLLLKDNPQIKHPTFIPLGMFLIFALTSALLAPVPITAWIGSPFRFTGLSTYLCCAILFILAMHTGKEEKLLRYMTGSAAIGSLLAILQYFGLNLVPHEPFRKGMISYGTMANPDFLGTYTAFILPAAVLLFLRSRKKVWLLCSVSIYAGLLVSLCRGAWLAALAGFLVIAASCRRDTAKRKPLLLLAGVFLATTLVLLPARDGLLLHRIISLSGEVSKGIKMDEGAGAYRFFIWQKSFKLFLRFWAFGIGPDHLLYAKIFTPNHALVDKAHNIFLEIALTMGIFALLSYLAFLSFFLRPARNEKGFLLFTMILVYLIQGFFNIDVVMIMPLFWIILGMSLSEYFI